MHQANHQEAVHHLTDVWEADPRLIAAGRRVELAWFSPDCTHFSRAKGGKPVSSGGMSLEDLRPLAPRLAERRWHVQLWIETGDLQALAPDLEKLPFDFVIDHMGRTMADKGVGYAGFRDFCEKLKTGRYWCKLSGADRNTRGASGKGASFDDTAAFMQCRRVT